MKVIVLALITMALISVGSSYTLHQMGFSSQDRTTGGAVRLD
jgi:hypothetical protein